LLIIYVTTVQDIDHFEAPRIDLEQYPTGAEIASRMLFTVSTFSLLSDEVWFLDVWKYAWTMPGYEDTGL
jgi:predicted RNA methylase